MWPDARAYREALQNPRTCFVDDELKDSQPVQHGLFPLSYAGHFATVFKVRTSNKTVAVRCFLREQGDRAKRYSAIDAFLSRAQVSCISNFEYVENGIRIGGRLYPLLIMDWVEGHTLDAYVRSDAARVDTFRALATRWIEVVGELEAAGIAHGDLQHGNVLVSGGDIKLVDYDGMFVPPMAGAMAAEQGLAAYQHPKRTPSDYNKDIDRFASLVIYTSLAALGEKLDLIRFCSSDNLLFTAEDYRQPNSSDAFRALSGLSPAVNRVAHALRDACIAPFSQTPRLLDLVAPPAATKLPGWMRSTGSIPTPTKVTAEPPRHGGMPASLPPQTAPSQPTTGTSNPTLPSPPRTTTAAAPTTQSSRKVFKWGSFVSLGIAWMIAYAFFVASWLKGDAAVVVFFIGVAIAFANSFETESSQPVHQPRPTPIRLPPSAPGAAMGSGGAVIASAIRSIYHRPTCEWAYKMSSRNRRQYSSAAAAAMAGLRPCRVCRP
jgi:hypothetical protein